MIQLTHAKVSLPAGNALNRLKAVLLPKQESKGRETVLYDCTLWLGRGESWAVLGEKDAGKTTLLRLIAGRVQAESGICSVQGSVAAAIADEDGIFRHESGAGNVRLYCQAQGMNKADTEARVRDVEAMCGLRDQFNKPASSYTTQMRARLALSIAICAKPDVLLISSLLEACEKPFAQQYIIELRKLQSNGMTLLLECEDETILSRLCESAIWMVEGRLYRLGALESVYAAYSRPKRLRQMQDNENGKAWLAQQQVAFSSAFSPATEDWAQQTEPDCAHWPPDAKNALSEAQAHIERLESQLNAYVQANIAFDQANSKLDEGFIEMRNRLDEMEKKLKSMPGPDDP